MFASWQSSCSSFSWQFSTVIGAQQTPTVNQWKSVKLAAGKCIALLACLSACTCVLVLYVCRRYKHKGDPPIAPLCAFKVKYYTSRIIRNGNFINCINCISGSKWWILMNREMCKEQHNLSLKYCTVGCTFDTFWVCLLLCSIKYLQIFIKCFGLVGYNPVYKMLLFFWKDLDFCHCCF